jgi:hypothetical protein
MKTQKECEEKLEKVQGAYDKLSSSLTDDSPADEKQELIRLFGQMTILIWVLDPRNKEN